jgi:hypothetical protein
MPDSRSQKTTLLIIILLVFLAVTVFFLKDQGIILRKTVRKPAVQKPDYVETLVNAQWRKYHRTEWEYEFEIPTEWVTSPDISPNIHREIYFPREGKPPYIIRVQAVPPLKLKFIPPFYCAENPKDTDRCQKMQVAGQELFVDWGNPLYPDKQTATLPIPHKYGGVVIFELTPVTPESKTQFDLILSTFRYTDGN